MKFLWKLEWNPGNFYVAPPHYTRPWQRWRVMWGGSKVSKLEPSSNWVLESWTHRLTDITELYTICIVLLVPIPLTNQSTSVADPGPVANKQHSIFICKRLRKNTSISYTVKNNIVIGLSPILKILLLFSSREFHIFISQYFYLLLINFRVKIEIFDFPHFSDLDPIKILWIHNIMQSSLSQKI